jgi:hypothetical protein
VNPVTRRSAGTRVRALRPRARGACTSAPCR